jgi:hypothetical protein
MAETPPKSPRLCGRQTLPEFVLIYSKQCRVIDPALLF